MSKHILISTYGSRVSKSFGGAVSYGNCFAMPYRVPTTSLPMCSDPARVRHPQYTGFVLIMIGFLFQWPTLVTLVMFPILVFMYVRLAQREEHDARAEFGDAYSRYEANTPAFFPRFEMKAHA